MLETANWDALACLTAGKRVFVPGSSGEPTAFLEAAMGRPGLLAGSEIITSFIAGVNDFDLLNIQPSLTVTSFFPLRTQSADGQARAQVIPISYFEIDGYLRRRGIDVAVIQVSPPDAAGQCSLGPCVEFSLTALANAKNRIGIINANIPQGGNAPTVAIEDFDMFIQTDAPLHGLDTSEGDPVSGAIAANVCQLIGDGAAMQTGIGKIPGQVLAGLTDRRGLRLHTGIITPAVRKLIEAGTMADTDAVVTGSAIGDAGFYQWLAKTPQIRIAEIRETHDPRNIMNIPDFMAINSAIEVDLRGQCNAEVINGKAISGAGGLPDFASAARRSKGGMSIIALPATDAKGRHSRIVAQLGAGAPVSVPRQNTDYVVTEYGIADLRDKTDAECADALISVAAPQFRDGLGMSLS